MLKINQESIAELNQLLSVCRRCQGAYFNAENREPAEELKSLYGQYSEAMAKNVAELELEIHRLGDVRPEESDEMTNLSEESIEDLQREALNLYDKALDEEWPEEVSDMLKRHFTLLEEAEDHISEVRELKYEKGSDEDSDTRDSKS
jgi:hypothetical protein